MPKIMQKRRESMKAFIMIDSEAGREAGILKALTKMKGVEEAYPVYGVCDIIAKVKFRTMEELRQLVFKRVRTLPDVKETRTAIVAVSPIKYPLTVDEHY